MVMNTQLVSMVIMMNMLNSVGGSRKAREQVGREADRGPSRPEHPVLLSPIPTPLLPPLRAPHLGRI